jgi:hypothetical protein
LAKASGLRSTAKALSSVHAPASETEASEQIKINAVSISFPLSPGRMSLSGVACLRTAAFAAKRCNAAHECHAKQEARQLDDTSRSSAFGKRPSDGKQQVFVLRYAGGNRLSLNLGLGIDSPSSRSRQPSSTNPQQIGCVHRGHLPLPARKRRARSMVPPGFSHEIGL